MGKSKTVTELEIGYALMSGCDGIAFNANMFYDNCMLMDIVRERKAFWDEITKRTEGTYNCGIYCTEQERIGVVFMDIGLPVTADSKMACAHVLTGESAAKYSDAEILKILSGSVFLDGVSLDILTERGFGEFCGVKSDKYYDNGIMERFSESKINDVYGGYIRSAWINFDGSKTKTASLKLLDDSVEVVSEMITIQKKYIGPCTTLYENKLSGRVAVSTYLFPRFLQYSAKRTQLLNIFEWLLKGTLPVRVNKDHKITPVMRKNENGEYVLMLANMSFDDTGAVSADIKTGNNSCKRINTDGSVSEVKTKKTDSGIMVMLDNIKPWETVILSDIEV